MRRETKIGILAVISIALALWGYQYLKGINVLSNATILYAEYGNIDGMRLSTPIRVNGFEVGLVSEIHQKGGDLNTIVVEMNLHKGIHIPKSATAEIIPAGFMGGHFINLNFEGTCSGKDCAKSGDYIKGNTLGMMASMLSQQDLTSYMETLNEGLKKMLDTLTTQLSKNEEVKSVLTDVRDIVSNLKSSTGRMDRLMANSTSSIEGTMANMDSITGNLAANKEQINMLLENAGAFSSQLKDANISGTLDEANATLKQLKTTLETAEKAMADVNELLAKVKEGDGTIAMLMNDPKMAEQLKMTAKHMNLFLQDFRLHPERYRRILSKKKMPYKPPENDPGLKEN